MQYNKSSFLFIILYSICYLVENSQENWFVPSFSEFKQNLKTCCIENYFFIKRVSFLVITRVLAICFVIGLSYRLIFSLTHNKSNLFTHILVILCSQLVANICISGLPFFKNYIHYLWHWNALYFVIHIITGIKSSIGLLQESQVNQAASVHTDEAVAEISVHPMAPGASSSVHTHEAEQEPQTLTYMPIIPHNARIDDTSIHRAAARKTISINMDGMTQPAFISVQGEFAMNEGMLNILTNPMQVIPLLTSLVSLETTLDNANSSAPRNSLANIT